MKLSRHLSLHEVLRSARAERMGIDNKPSLEHLANIKAIALHIFQPLRDAMGEPITVTSGYRSAALNSVTPGASRTSQHSTGEALDLVLRGRNAQMFHYIRTHLIFDQLIWEHGTAREPQWVHVSFRRASPNRQQVLVAKKSRGTTIYTPWKP